MKYYDVYNRLSVRYEGTEGKNPMVWRHQNITIYHFNTIAIDFDTYSGDVIVRFLFPSPGKIKDQNPNSL